MTNEDTTEPPPDDTTALESEDRPPELPALWGRGDGPLPNDTKKLVDEIKGLAAARQRDARTHRPFCTCDGCRLRRNRQAPLLRRDDAA